MPRRAGEALESEAARQGSRGGSAVGETGSAAVGERRQMRESLLAGIGEGRMGEGRVAEWRRHVGPLV